MKWSDVREQYRKIPVTRLKGKTIKAIKTDKFTDVFGKYPLLVITDSEKTSYILTNYPDDKPVLMILRKKR